MKYIRNSKAFTIIEVMIVFMILVTISGILFTHIAIHVHKKEAQIEVVQKQPQETPNIPNTTQESKEDLNKL